METKGDGPPHLSRKTFREAQVRAELAEREEPRAVSARFDREHERVIVELAGGVALSFPPARVPGLAGATPEQLEEITVLPFGVGVVWDTLDVDFSTSGLLVELLGHQPWRREMMRKAGSVSTDAKAAASRKNGKKGGRPRKATRSMGSG